MRSRVDGDRRLDTRELALGRDRRRGQSEVAGEFFDSDAEGRGIRPLTGRRPRGQRRLLDRGGRGCGRDGTRGGLDRRAERLGGVGAVESVAVGRDRRRLGFERLERDARARAVLLLLAQRLGREVRGLRGGVGLVGGIAIAHECFGPVRRPLDGALPRLEAVCDRTDRAGRIDVGRLARKVVRVDQPLGLAEQEHDTVAGGGERPLGVFAALLECGLVVLVGARAEELAQQSLAIVVLREQEFGEPALREQDHLQELLLVQPEDLIELARHVDGPGSAADPRPVDELVELGAVGLGGQTGTAVLRALVLGRAGHAPARADGAELDRHARRVIGRAVVAAQALLDTVVAGRAAVQREAHAVEHARLARAGATRDEEDAVGGERVEVDHLTLSERPEALELEAMQSHALASTSERSSMTSRMSSASRSDAPSPSRTCVRNASTSSASLRAARTRRE